MKVEIIQETKVFNTKCIRKEIQYTVEDWNGSCQQLRLQSLGIATSSRQNLTLSLALHLEMNE